MKLWIDDIRPAPDRYVWCKSVNQAKRVFCKGYEIEWIESDDVLSKYIDREKGN